MLVKLVDTKDETYWINPLYVRVLREKKGITEVHCVAGGGVMTGVIKIKEPIDEVAMQLNVGLLGENSLPPSVTDSSSSSNPAVNAALMG